MKLITLSLNKKNQCMSVLYKKLSSDFVEILGDLLGAFPGRGVSGRLGPFFVFLKLDFKLVLKKIKLKNKLT